MILQSKKTCPPTPVDVFLMFIRRLAVYSSSYKPCDSHVFSRNVLLDALFRPLFRPFSDFSLSVDLCIYRCLYLYFSCRVFLLFLFYDSTVLSIYLSLCLSVSLSLSLSLSLYLYRYLSLYLSLSISISIALSIASLSLFLYFSIFLSIHPLSIHPIHPSNPSIHLSIYRSIVLSFYLSNLIYSNLI